MRSVLVELTRIGARKACHVSCEFDDGELHAETDPEERNSIGAGVPNRGDLAFGPAIAEAARNQDCIERGKQSLGAFLLDLLGVDVLELYATVVGEPSVDARFVERFVGVLEVNVLANESDADGPARGVLEASHDALPRGKIGGAAPDIEPF